jgi:hypothetical protein
MPLHPYAGEEFDAMRPGVDGVAWVDEDVRRPKTGLIKTTGKCVAFVSSKSHVIRGLLGASRVADDIEPESTEICRMCDGELAACGQSKRAGATHPVRIDLDTVIVNAPGCGEGLSVEVVAGGR